MTRFQLQAAMVALTMLAAACTRRQPAPPAPAAPPRAPVPAPAPPSPPVPNMFVLLPDPAGNHTSIVVSNSAGAQEINQPNQAVRVPRADTPPSAPFSMDQSMVERLFGAAMRAVPEPEIQFVLYFDEARDTLNADAQAAMASILRAVQERRSTDISVTGHTDRTGTTEGNYQLGLRRAERVAALLRAQGVDDSSLFVTSHGESDPLFKTGPGIAEPRNRRVEVIVH
jgi:outer membrane protein OmpA-like peptidoglycan-associated protein